MATADRTTVTIGNTTLTHAQVRNAYREMCFAEWRETVETVARSVLEDFKGTDRDDAIPQACDGVLVYSQNCTEYLSASKHGDDWQEYTPPEDYVRAAIALEGDVRDWLERNADDDDTDD